MPHTSCNNSTEPLDSDPLLPFQDVVPSAPKNLAPDKDIITNNDILSPPFTRHQTKGWERFSTKKPSLENKTGNCLLQVNLASFVTALSHGIFEHGWSSRPLVTTREHRGSLGLCTMPGQICGDLDSVKRASLSSDFFAPGLACIRPARSLREKVTGGPRSP